MVLCVGGGGVRVGGRVGEKVVGGWEGHVANDIVK